ncbi:FeoB-associated Cys-rich membrane protein [Phocoenobacter uteri]|uniref:FeoB-associated Cys-rich membrane protein n=1 Tax=Phocoenobacter uteri TaxID=146806 RepID=UPI0015598310|nr:FeoB-associated Cys-rich membrane protein [Phocoenobacter uteri]
MSIKELIVIITVLVILSIAIFSMIRMKKKGAKCIGCPSCSQQHCASRNKLN